MGTTKEWIAVALLVAGSLLTFQSFAVAAGSLPPTVNSAKVVKKRPVVKNHFWLRVTATDPDATVTSMTVRYKNGALDNFDGDCYTASIDGRNDGAQSKFDLLIRKPRHGTTRKVKVQADSMVCSDPPIVGAAGGESDPVAIKLFKGSSGWKVESFK